MNESVQNNLLATGPIGRLIARFAIPSMVAMLVNALYNIVDQIFIGQAIGYMGNGAANVVLLITLITLSISMLLGDGAAAWFSLKLGQGNKEEAKKGAGTAIASIIIVSLLCTVIGLVFLEPIIRLMGGTELLLPLAKKYAVPTLLALPFIMISTTLNALIRTDGSPRFAMASMITGAIVNGCLDPLFIFVFGWGIEGAAAATFCGQLVSLIISLSYLKRFKQIKLTRDCFRIKFKMLFTICSLGVSSFIDQIAFTLVLAVNNNLIVHYGAMSPYGSEIPLTAYGIAMKVQEILFTVLLGLAIGMQPIVGFNYGAGKFRRVKKAYLFAVGVGTAISIAATIIFVFFPEPIIAMFGTAENPLYLEFSKKFFSTYFLVYIFFGFQTITGVFFQAIGKPLQASVIALSYQLVFKILSALILTAFMGLNGILWSGPIADICIFIMALAFVIPCLRKISRLTERSNIS